MKEDEPTDMATNDKKIEEEKVEAAKTSETKESTKTV